MIRVDRATSRNSHAQKQPPEVFCKKGIFRNFAKFTGIQLFKKETLLIKNRLWHMCFPVNFVKISKNPFSTEYLRTTYSAICKALMLSPKGMNREFWILHFGLQCVIQL